VAHERSRSPAAGRLTALDRAAKRARTRLVPLRTGAALRLRAGGTGAPLRPQRELGIASPGPGGTAARGHPTAGARWQDRSSGGDEVSGAGCAHQPGRLRTPGSHLRAIPLRHARCRTTLCRLARRHARGARAHPRRAGVVSQNAASHHGRRRTASGARSGGSRRHAAPHRPTTQGSPAAHGHHAAAERSLPDRHRAPGTGPDGGTTRKGKRRRTC
jgi:hypothetical protein